MYTIACAWLSPCRQRGHYVGVNNVKKKQLYQLFHLLKWTLIYITFHISGMIYPISPDLLSLACQLSLFYMGTVHLMKCKHTHIVVLVAKRLKKKYCNFLLSTLISDPNIRIIRPIAILSDLEQFMVEVSLHTL